MDMDEATTSGTNEKASENNNGKPKATVDSDAAKPADADVIFDNLSRCVDSLTNIHDLI